MVLDFFLLLDLQTSLWRATYSETLLTINTGHFMSGWARLGSIPLGLGSPWVVVAEDVGKDPSPAPVVTSVPASAPAEVPKVPDVAGALEDLGFNWGSRSHNGRVNAS